MLCIDIELSIINFSQREVIPPNNFDLVVGERV